MRARHAKPVRLTRRGHVVLAAVGAVLVVAQTAAVVSASASSAGLLFGGDPQPVEAAVGGAGDRAASVDRADRAGRATDLPLAVPSFDRIDDEFHARPAVAEPVPGAPVTAVFGEDGSNWQHRHTGLDFNGFTGDKIRAMTDATVVDVREHPAYGTMLIMRRADGVEIWYAHLSKVLVRHGDVTAGQPVALMGTTGNSTGSHLHMEVRVKGIPTDPAEFLWGATPGQPADPPGWVCRLYPGC